MAQIQNSDSALVRLAGKAASQDLQAITAICTAHFDVLQVALDDAAANNAAILIEATCNQVNQDGGYTGMTPEQFSGRVVDMAAQVGLDADLLILGGDHLGPNPWKDLSASMAMEKAEVMVAAFVRAGFRKLHLDTSMGCANEPEALGDDIVAERAARLAAVAERTAQEHNIPLPIYIIGTEVPPPGGATHGLDDIEVTHASAARRTVEIHREAFEVAGIETALGRVIGLVVQPGVEFGDEEIAIYAPEKTVELAKLRDNFSGLTFEAHSTDYQPPEKLRALATDGFAILKVGPALTFAWRECLYGLDHIRAILTDTPATLMQDMEVLMLDDPKYWKSHYHGAPSHERVQRHFSYSDRIRYYWPTEQATKRVDALFADLEGINLPATLIGQYLGAYYADVVSGTVKPTARDLAAAAVKAVLADYRQASLR